MRHDVLVPRGQVKLGGNACTMSPKVRGELTGKHYSVSCQLHRYWYVFVLVVNIILGYGMINV
jgi:hypothetical protein